MSDAQQIAVCVVVVQRDGAVLWAMAERPGCLVHLQPGYVDAAYYDHGEFGAMLEEVLK